jgi:small subunit ribosomal protein S2e
MAKKLLQMAGFEDLFTTSIGHTKTTTNFLTATYKAIQMTYKIQTPDQWEPRQVPDHPFVQFTDYLAEQNEQKVTKVDINLAPA